MKSKENVPPSQEKNYRVRFRDSAQLELVKKAARHQGISFNVFVTTIAESAARLLLQKPNGVDQTLKTAAAEVLNER